MRNFTTTEILKFTEKEIDDLFINNTFEFETYSKIGENKYKFKAIILDQTLAINTKPFDLQIIIIGETNIIDLNIINIKSMKYIC